MTVTIRRPDGTEIVLTGHCWEISLVLKELVGRMDLEPESDSNPESDSGVELTEMEKRFLAQEYGNGCRWIARDEDGDLYVFEEKPEWHGETWGSPSDKCKPAPSELFSFVGVEDDEPTEIEPLIRDFIEEVKQ